MKKFISASINLNTSNHMNIGEVKQLDDVELDLSIYSNGVAAPLDGQIISLFVRRANNTIVQQVEGITPTGSTLKIKCKNSCFAVKGNTELELRLVDSTGGMSTSFFYVKVLETVGNNDNIDIAKDEYEILDKINKDEVQRIANEETRISNENIRQEAYKEIKSISSDIFKSSGSEIKIVDITDWVDNTDSNSSAKYMYDIAHALKSTDVILDIYSSTSNMSMLKNCRVISDSIVRLFSDEKIGVKAVLIACYNIQGKQAYDEVVAARGSYNTIGKRFDGIDLKVGEWNNFKNSGGTIGDSLTFNTASSTLTDVIETNKNFLRLKNKTTNLLLAEQILHGDENSAGKIYLGNIQYPFLDLYLKDTGSVKNAIIVQNVELSKTNGCVDYGSGYAPLKGYRVGNMVHIQGVVSGNTNKICINIQFEHRPKAILVIPCFYVDAQSTWASGVCTIESNGNITLPSTVRSCSLDITYFI